MAEYLIESKDREFRFQGELLASQEATVNLLNDISCQLSATTYAIDDGGYVSSLEFRLSNHPSDPIVLFEEIDVMEDVEKFYYVFEPVEIFKNNSGSVEEREEIAANCRILSQAYEKMIFCFLDFFQAESELRGTQNKPKPVKTKGLIWKKLGIK